MKGVIFSAFVLLALLVVPSVSAYTIDFTVDNSSYMCGDVVHGTLHATRMSDESIDHNRTFRVSLFPPGVVNPNGELYCIFNEDGRTLSRCNGFGIGKRQVTIIAQALSKDVHSARASQDSDSTLEGAQQVPFHGNGNGKNSTNVPLPVSDGFYDIWIDTGVYVDDSTGTCYMGTYGVTLAGQVNGENILSDYRAYEVYSVSNRSLPSYVPSESIAPTEGKSVIPYGNPYGFSYTDKLAGKPSVTTSTEAAIKAPQPSQVQSATTSSLVPLMIFAVCFLAIVTMAVYLRVSSRNLPFAY